MGDVTNFEVLELLKKNKEKHATTRKLYAKEIHNALTIEEQVIRYLNKTPIAEEDLETFQELLTKLKKYPLTKQDRLQVCNTLPQSEVEPYIVYFDTVHLFQWNN